MEVGVKWLFTLMAVAFMSVGVLAIVTESHTGYAKHIGMVTNGGEDAIWWGKTFLLLGVMPMFVWIPKRFLVVFLVTWWVALMAWIFGGIYLK